MEEEKGLGDSSSIPFGCESDDSLRHQFVSKQQPYQFEEKNNDNSA